MEIRFSHGAARWGSHTRFHAFRSRLAREVGVELDAMEGYFGHRPWDGQGGALRPLLEASDVDGALPWNACGPAAVRLRAVARAWAEADPDRAAALALAEGLELAAMLRQTFRLQAGPLAARAAGSR